MCKCRINSAAKNYKKIKHRNTCTTVRTGCFIFFSSNPICTTVFLHIKLQAADVDENKLHLLLFVVVAAAATGFSVVLE